MTLWNESLWAAYATDWPSDEIFLTSVGNNGSGTVSYHGVGPSNLGEGFIFPPSLIGYNGSLHVFYTQEAANGQSSSVIDGMYDGRTWSQYTTIDATSGHFETAPAAVAFKTALYVFYGDSGGQLRMRAASSGTNWGPVHVVDGPGATAPGAHTSDVLGAAPAVIVDNASTSNLHVFYYDTTKNALLEAWSSTGTNTSWQYSTVATGVSSSYAVSPVLVNGGTLQVYYVDPNSGTLQVAQKTSLTGTTWTRLTLDGYGGICGTHTADTMGDSVAAVTMSNGKPQVFYTDATAGTLRVATFQ
jgi:hypothetical protein